MWWKWPDNIKTVMVVEDGKKHDRSGMVEMGRQRRRSCEGGKEGRRQILLMIERRRQHNRDSVVEEKGRQ